MSRLNSVVGIALMALGLLFADAAAAIEPRNISVEGRAEVDAENDGRARDLAFHSATVAASMRVARSFLSPSVFLAEEERIREFFKEAASSFILTYRVDGPLRRYRSREDPEKSEVRVKLTVTVDAAQVREALRELKLLQDRSDRPSLVFQLRRAPGMTGGAASLAGLENLLGQRFQQAEFVVIEPALQPANLDGLGAIELAQRIGADIGIELQVDWRPAAISDRVSGGTAELVARARRARDGSEVAKVQLEAPGYHADPDEAFARAIEAIQDQLAQNLVFQLERNWQVLGHEDRAIRLQLANVTGWGQVSEVQRTLQNVLGAERADVVELQSLSALLLVSAPLSAGALQERLAGASYEGFSLESMGISDQGIVLRVEPDPVLPEPNAPALEP